MSWRIKVQTDGFGSKEQEVDSETSAYLEAIEISKKGFWFNKRLYPAHMINYIEVVEYK